MAIRLKEFIWKLKNLKKKICWQKNQSFFFLSFSSSYYRYRLSRKSNKNKPYFRREVFVFSASEIYIVCLCTIYPRIPPSKRQKSDFPLKLPPKYRAFFDFFVWYIFCFTDKILKKSFFSQITPIILGTFLTSNAQQVISPQIAPTISSIYLTFLSDNLLCFTHKIPKKSLFPQIAAIILGTYSTFLPDNPVCFY